MINLKSYLPASRKAQLGVGAGAVLAVLLLIAFLSLDTADPPDLALFVGRFHPMLVHLPIGFLLAAFLLEGAARFSRFKGLGQAVPFLLGLGALGAAAAAVAGSLLALGGGYDESLIFWHQRLGIAVAVLATLALLFNLMARNERRLVFSRLYGVLLVGTVGLLGAAGHLGGSLTHGEGYLTRYLPDPVRKVAGMPPQGANMVQTASIADATVYGDLVKPILEARCVECHNPNKMKGELRLDTPEMILAGGETGDVLIPNDAEGSELFRRVILPPSDEDHMPSTGDPLTLEQIEILRWWIAGGASFDQKVMNLEPNTPAIQLVLDWRYGPQADRPTGVFALDVPSAEPSDIERLQEAGASVVPVAQDKPLLQVHASKTFGDSDVEALRPLAQQIVWLDLSGTNVTDAGLAVLADLPHLARLHLEQTSVTDAGLAHLEGHEYLHYLNLYGTSVTDEAVPRLAALENLETLYLWQTEVSSEGAEQLRKERPGLRVDNGFDPESFSVEVAATED